MFQVVYDINTALNSENQYDFSKSINKLEELEDEISTILAGGQVGRVLVNLN